MESNQRQFKFNRIHLLLMVAILAGSALRFARLKEIPPGLNQDEAVNGYDAYSLFVTGRDHHGHPFPFAGLESFGDWVSPLLTFLTIPSVALFGLRVESLRAVTAGMGVLAIPIIYWLGTELFRRRSIGVVAAWYLALSPWHVHRAHFATPSSIVPTMVLLTMAILVWTVNHYSARGIVALGLVASLTIATYPTMKLYIPLLLAAGLIIYGQTVLRLNR